MLVEEFLWILGTLRVSGVRVVFFIFFSAQIVTKLCPDRVFRFEATGPRLFFVKGFLRLREQCG